MLLIHKSWIKDELGVLFGNRVVDQITKINRLYDIYDGTGQSWPVAGDLEYTPNRTITNLIKKLIKAEARFMVSRAPEIKLVPEQSEDADAAAEIEKWLTGVLNGTSWQRKLIQAARDCFIGKRVAMKISGGRDTPLRIDFRPAQEFVFDTIEDDTSSLRKIIFFYQVDTGAEEYDHEKQRIWRQRYELENGRCYLDEGLFDGNGRPVNIVYEHHDTGLDSIPCRVIINDGLTGDLEGESDVELLLDNQATYNKLNSDDADALRFNMFPMRYVRDATAESVKALVIAPGALADLASDPSQTGRTAEMGIIESDFNYDGRIENRLNRTKNDMYELLSIPNISLEQLKGLAQSGKGIDAIYRDLIARCEEKWAEGWDDALRWMVEMLIKMARTYGAAALPEIPYNITIDHLYPIPDSDEDERLNDMAEVRHQVRSRSSYIQKWQPGGDADGELAQIKQEQALLEDAYAGAIRDELAAAPPKNEQKAVTETEASEADVTEVIRNG
jgi:hypothetical protein